MWKNRLKYWFDNHKSTIWLSFLTAACITLVIAGLLFFTSGDEEFETEEHLLAAVYNFKDDTSIEVKKIDDNVCKVTNGRQIETTEWETASECQTFVLKKTDNFDLKEYETEISGVYSMNAETAKYYLGSINLEKELLVLKPDYFEFYYKSKGKVFRMISYDEICCITPVTVDFRYKSLDEYLYEAVSIDSKEAMNGRK